MYATGVNARKKTGLGEFFKDYTPQQLEEQKIIPALDNKIIQALAEYQTLIQNEKLSWWVNEPHTYPAGSLNTILTPSEINIFLAAGAKYGQYNDYRLHHDVIGIFISKLIQNSYEAGHNDFILNTQGSSPLGYLASRYIHGTEENPVRVTVVGSVGMYCGLMAEYLHLVLNGDAEQCFAYNAKHSQFTLNGYIDFTIGLDTQDTIFKTPHVQTKKTMIQSFIMQHKRFENFKPEETRTIMFIHPDGCEEQVWGKKRKKQK